MQFADTDIVNYVNEALGRMLWKKLAGKVCSSDT